MEKFDDVRDGGKILWSDPRKRQIKCGENFIQPCPQDPQCPSVPKWLSLVLKVT